MNEFTKKELKELMYGLYCIAKLDDGMANKILYEKIKSMIDSYDAPCEHKNCRRVSLLDGHDYDICPNCDYIRQMR